MRGRILKGVLILTAVIVCGAIVWITRREHKLVTAFQNMPVGTMQAETKAQLGAPWKAGACGQVFGGNMPPGCKEEYIYASPYARLSPPVFSPSPTTKSRTLNVQRLPDRNTVNISRTATS